MNIKKEISGKAYASATTSNILDKWCPDSISMPSVLGKEITTFFSQSILCEDTLFPCYEDLLK